VLQLPDYLYLSPGAEGENVMFDDSLETGGICAPDGKYFTCVLLAADINTCQAKQHLQQCLVRASIVHITVGCLVLIFSVALGFSLGTKTDIFL